MNYVYEGLDPTGQLEEEVKASDVFPLVRELRFKYDLQVTNSTKHRSGNNAYALCNPMGYLIGHVFTDDDPNGMKGEKQFCYYSNFYQKDRGVDQTDRKTLRSKKLSSLMNTLKKNDVIPSEKKVIEARHNFFAFDQILKRVQDQVGDPRKQALLNPHEVQRLLKVYFGNGVDPRDRENDNKKFQQVLDNYIEKDNIMMERERVANEFFNSCWMVSVNKTGQFHVSVIKKVKGETSETFEFIKQPKRVLTLDEYPELLSYMTMLKTYLENHPDIYEGNLYGGYIPKIERYIEPLDMHFTNTYIDGHNDSSSVWLLTPCSTI